MIAAALSVVLGVTALGSSAARPDRRAALDRASERLMELERDFELVVERYNVAHERLISIRSQIGATELEVEAIERRMASKEKAAVMVATQLYKAGSAGALGPLLTASSISEIETRVQYLNSSQEAHRELFENLAADRAELNAVLAKLQEQRDEVAATEAQLRELRTTIEAKVGEQRDEITELTAAIERAEARRRARLEAARRAARAAAREEARRERAAAHTAKRDAPAADSQAPPSRPAPAPTSAAQAAVNAALSQVGKPYQWGGAGPDSYDCSGLTMWAWRQAGVSLPHSSQMQFDSTAHVDQSDWQPGDLLFFGSPIHHVGMYIGNGRMVEAPYTGLSVRVVSASRSDYAGAGRPGV